MKRSAKPWVRHVTLLVVGMTSIGSRAGSISETATVEAIAQNRTKLLELDSMEPSIIVPSIYELITLKLQTDGVIAIYSGAKPIWAIGTSNPALCLAPYRCEANIAASGIIKLKQFKAGVLQQTISNVGSVSDYAASFLELPYVLASDAQPITNAVNLKLQTDGNIVAYRGARPVWSTGTPSTDIYICDPAKRSRHCHATFDSTGKIELSQSESGKALKIIATWNLNVTGQASRFVVTASSPFFYSQDDSTGKVSWSACLQPSQLDPSVRSDEALINEAFQTGGKGMRVSLCPNATYYFRDSVVFGDANQELATDLLSSGDQRAKIIVNTGGMVPAISIYQTNPDDGQARSSQCDHCSGIALKNLDIDGGSGLPAATRAPTSPNFGLYEPNCDPLDSACHVTYRAALIELGGPCGSDQVVSNVHAHHSRGWSTLHFDGGYRRLDEPQSGHCLATAADIPKDYNPPITEEGVVTCRGARILNSQFDSAGENFDDNHNPRVADGLSLGCKDSMVSGNTFTDITDGAIVLFAAHGTAVVNNQIVSQNNELLSGIGMVDFSLDSVGKPIRIDGLDYHNIFIENNKFLATPSINHARMHDGYIKFGIVTGAKPWVGADSIQSTFTLDGAGTKILDNNFYGNIFYGIFVSGINYLKIADNDFNLNAAIKPDFSACAAPPQYPQAPIGPLVVDQVSYQNDPAQSLLTSLGNLQLSNSAGNSQPVQGSKYVFHDHTFTYAYCVQ